MTPELMEEGARRLAAYEARMQASTGTESGDRQAAFGRVAKMGEPDFAHGVALYLDDITVSFDGFRALNKLSLAGAVGADDAAQLAHVDGQAQLVQRPETVEAEGDVIEVQRHAVGEVGSGVTLFSPPPGR